MKRHVVGRWEENSLLIISGNKDAESRNMQNFWRDNKFIVGKELNKMRYKDKCFKNTSDIKNIYIYIINSWDRGNENLFNSAQKPWSYLLSVYTENNRSIICVGGQYNKLFVDWGREVVTPHIYESVNSDKMYFIK